MNQSHKQQVLNKVFTSDQIAEQKQFIGELENNTADIVFEGTFDDGIDFLKDTGELVDTFNHA